MITGLDHVAVILSREEHLDFYLRLGFTVESRRERPEDILLMLSGPCPLEVFVKPASPARPDAPEALGLRHLALRVDDVEATIRELGLVTEPIREIEGVRYTFLKDPDGLPVELHE